MMKNSFVLIDLPIIALVLGTLAPFLTNSSVGSEQPVTF